jgi:hypothetical protein
MANRRFTGSSFIGGLIVLKFALEDGTNELSVTLPLNEANQLTAGLLNALRSAEQQGSQIPPLRLSDKQSVWINELPVDQWRVTTSPDVPGRVFLHLLAAGGLYLTYGFAADAAQFAIDALGAAAAGSKKEQN